MNQASRRKLSITARKNPLIERQPKRIVQRKWHLPLWKEIRQIQDPHQRDVSTLRFVEYLRAQKYGVYKGVRYAITSDPKVLETISGVIPGLSKPIITLPSGLSKKAQRSILDHELIEWKKGNTVAHSEKRIAYELAGRRRVKKEVLALLGKANKRELRKMQETIRSQAFKKLYNEYSSKFSKIKKISEELRRLGIPLDDAEWKRHEALDHFLKARKEYKKVVINGQKFMLRFDPKVGDMILEGKYFDYAYTFGRSKGEFYSKLSTDVVRGSDNMEHMTVEGMNKVFDRVLSKN